MASNLYDELTGDRAPLQTPATVMTVGAHPDDAEFGAGATLARWNAEGTETSMLIVTDGSKGSWDSAIPDTELVAARHAEQERAASVLGVASVIHLDHVDGELEYTFALRKEIASHIRRVKPDVVLCHDPWQRYQLHPDHRATGLAAVDAVVSAREPRAYRELDLPAHRPSALLLWSADEPDHCEPVEPEWFDRKVEALLCHSSQSATTMGDAQARPENRLRFVDALAVWLAENGERFGIGPAEIFKKIVP